MLHLWISPELCLTLLFGRGLWHAKFSSHIFAKKIVVWQRSWDSQQVKYLDITLICKILKKYLLPDQLLHEKRRIFIRSVGAGTINALLGCRLEDRVISQEDTNKVRDENDTVMDKARALIDLVIGKGPESCCKFIKHLCEEDPPLASKMCVHKE
ncbi:caspase recruitment domain-containing protein 18-like [Sapajus apella]|uniref:Caspase recruitment domain-containing protein 18-like n=1 Tax=Sapajus apella TaxID=9515 RepID=A0A6J3IGI2_SAPAP|nr:caspase recruitment domain-containing protein 18-like [Sapajus apella]